MLFNSLEYLIFLPVVFFLYWFATNKNLRIQNLLLLLSSYVFYGWWDWRFLSLIIFSSILDYCVGLKLDGTQVDVVRKRWLYVSLISNLGLLAIFKYFNFFAESFSTAMLGLGWKVDNLTLDIILPVGISFYTFQTLSYTLDIYRGKFNATKDWLVFFTYVSFFPQLVAGPIERASHLIPQIEKKRSFNEKWFNEGIFQIFIGLFRKIVIADNLAVYVDTVYGNPDIYGSSTVLIATIFYSFQIYFDFAGYSDIAIGTAKLFGFEFNPNFNFPYFSKSITEFWRRWHMSLSFWLRDYLYISLGGNRKGIKITYRNLMITMLLGGLWHGSSWNFVIWGGIHGVLLSIEKFTKSKWNFKVSPIIGVCYTYLVVLYSWIFFRAQSFSDAVAILKKLTFPNLETPFIGNINSFIVSLVMLLIGLSFDFFLFKKNQIVEDFGSMISTKKLVSLVVISIMLLTLFYSSSNNFIYFQF
ncbi:MBOAT family O-acyltransferase [Flagellimonas beolgyonensis]|uniref:MBOAT family O-acyltransferase n=1 Tax=Flagellimonas beolgyonensis TaxID=864064 RepID=UPI003D65CC5B